MKPKSDALEEVERRIVEIGCWFARGQTDLFSSGDATWVTWHMKSAVFKELKSLRAFLEGPS